MVFILGIWIFHWDIFHINLHELNFLFRTLFLRLITFLGICALCFLIFSNTSHWVEIISPENLVNIDNKIPIKIND